jgi:hypothetical protein
MECFKLFIGMVCKKFQDTQRKEYFLFRNKFPVLQFCHEWRVRLRAALLRRDKVETLKG